MKRILVIEDNQEIRENLIEILELEEYFVLSANEGRSGFEIVITELPNLILCDVMMPQMDGHQVLDAVKTNPLTKNIPFIFITSSKEKRCLLRVGQRRKRLHKEAF